MTVISGGEAADQVVRMSLETGEVALKITGQGAKHLAALLYAILKEQKKTRGRIRMESLIRSGKPLTVFSVKESDLKAFVEGAKKYGVLYCAVRNPRGTSDGMVDVMVKQEDAVRTNRIVERFKFAEVTETATVKAEIEQARAEKGKQASGQEPVEKGRRSKDAADRLADELLAKPVQKEGESLEAPFPEKTENYRPSEPISKKQNKIAEGTSKQPEDRRSVREELKEIRTTRKKEAELPQRKEKEKNTGSRGGQNTHRQ
ncbi:DUF3801 domain-containing protein, partial [Anaerovorax odorimutans]|nr:DUF3801 domain-containing protein [Anaerovorax odorimutans]